MMTMALSTNIPIASTKAANDTRHGSACRIKEQKRTEYGDDQADTYDKAALEPHCYHQYQYYDDDLSLIHI